MRALSLWDPWAHLLANGSKRVETRSWMTTYTGPVAIHATRRLSEECRRLCFEDPFYFGLFGCSLRADIDAGNDPHARVARLARGAVIATARLLCCEPTDSPLTEAVLAECGPDERRFGDYAPGRWAWVFGKVEAFKEPVRAKGGRGLWEWSER